MVYGAHHIHCRWINVSSKVHNFIYWFYTGQVSDWYLNGIKSAGTYKLSFRKKTEKRLKNKKKRTVWYRTYTVLYWAVQALNQYTVQFTIVHVPVSCWTSKYHQYQTVLQTLVSSTSNHIHMVLSIGCNDLKNNNSNLSFIKVLSYKWLNVYCAKLNRR